MSGTKRTGISEFADIRYLSPETTSFHTTPGGFLGLHIDPDEDYTRVTLYRAFPLSLERRYISVRDSESNEIGMIMSIDNFPSAAKDLIAKELERNYFTPKIQSIYSIKEEFGYTYWDVETDQGRRRFTVRGGHNSLMSVTESRILVIDVDGNRFDLPDYKKLDQKSYKTVESLL